MECMHEIYVFSLCGNYCGLMMLILDVPGEEGWEGAELLFLFCTFVCSSDITKSCQSQHSGQETSTIQS